MAKLAYTKCSSLSLCTESMIELLLVEESMYEFSSYLIYLPPSILQIIMMSFDQKRTQFSNRIRKEQKESLFKKIRMSLLLQRSQEQEKDKKQVTASGQYEIIDSIRAFRKEGVSIMFESVNEYILAFKGTFTEEFKVELTKVVLDSFRDNGHAIVSLAHLLFDSTDALVFKEIDNFKEKIKLLIRENLRENEKNMQSIKNGEPIAFLLYNILNLHENKEDLYFLPNYYSLFAESIGYFNQAFLLLLQSGSRIRYLLPEEAFLQSFLIRDLPYQQLTPISMMVICQFLENYVCFNLSKDLYCQLSKWIERRLKERKFSLKLKQNLIKIITIAIHYEQVIEYIDSNEADLNIFQEISTLARFGNAECKVEALDCLACLATRCRSFRLEHLVDYFYLLEIMVYALQFTQDSDLTSKLLQALAFIVSSNQKYLKMAKNLGLKSYLYRLNTKQNVKLNELSLILLELFEEGY